MSDTASSPGPAAPPAEPHAPHHRVHLLALDGKAGETLALPLAFSEAVRVDVIRRAVNAARSARRQPHGTSLTAGRRHSVEWSGKGRGVARTPRLMGSMTGAQAPNTVGGGQAHPPRVDTIWRKKINTKERQLALRAALAATREAALARARGHRIPDGLHLPVVIEDPIEDLRATHEAQAFLARLKLWADVERASEGTHVRAGRGKRRGRYRHEPKSLLVVTSAPGKALGFRNLPGVDVVPVGRLGPEDLAPGGDPGRLTIFSRLAIQNLATRLQGGST
ncbi:MAG TPA: 50S ribosomal protein L4 [Thermoplasmata archaeon]|nr:50S ribosomal protein L4 [Thermoplasmata archaeon]HUI38168.1 50S ribosomal protein L4 [Thermoplasmata archaeon]